MNAFKDQYAKPALAAMLAREEGPDGALSCGHCGAQALPSLYRCTECFLTPNMCSGCTVKAHANNPLHAVEEWTTKDKFWNPTTLNALGLVMHLCHGGRMCEGANPNGRTLVVVHDSGIHSLRVTFCMCQNIAEPFQLIKHGLWPGTWTTPGTVFTLQVLRRYVLLTYVANANAQDFVRYLERITDETDMDNVRVSGSGLDGRTESLTGDVQERQRELLTTAREVEFVMSLKRSGQEAEKELEPGSLATLCPACPQPGINMDPDWQNAPPILR